MVIRPWLNLPTGGYDNVICKDNMVGVFSRENSPEGHTETHKSAFFQYINKLLGEMVIMNDLCDLLWNVQKRYAANRECSFKTSGQAYIEDLDHRSWPHSTLKMGMQEFLLDYSKSVVNTFYMVEIYKWHVYFTQDIRHNHIILIINLSTLLQLESGVVWRPSLEAAVQT